MSSSINLQLFKDFEVKNPFLILHVYLCIVAIERAVWDLIGIDCLVAVMVTGVSAYGHKDSSAVR